MISSATLSKTAALLLLLVALSLFGWLLAYALNIGMSDAKGDIERYVRLKTRLSDEVAGSNEVLGKAGHAHIYRNDYLAAGEDSVLLADLQKQVGSVIAANGSELLSAQGLPQRKRGGETSIGVRLHLRGSIDKIQRILHTVETARPLLFIERAIIRSDVSRQPNQPVAGLAAVRLSVELDVYGMRWPGDQPAKPAKR